MEMPIEVINAVKDQQVEQPTAKKKSRKPYMKECSKRILHAVGNGLRTASSIANALNEPKAKIVSRLWHLKDNGTLTAVKKQGSAEYKYYLNTDAPKLGQLDLTPKKRKYTKRATKVAELPPIKEVALTAENANRIVELNQKLTNMTHKLSAIELSLIEKEKEIWVLESEILDKKAIITYLEGKLALKGAI